ncbi:hypothetical protein NDU88_005901 [Pleurodeles waltl]|uniref:Uncharacterized protein n=1 Tax=Pleurodeles waltl TaxID=8319 RepID=A0AAV7MBX6_PLEWA|nr:hypothetical protein NDU88_005901 [Pleurodeles waltl]
MKSTSNWIKEMNDHEARDAPCSDIIKVSHDRDEVSKVRFDNKASFSSKERGKDSVTESVNKMIYCVKPGINQIVGRVDGVDERPIVMPECSVKLDNEDIKVLADSGSPHNMIGDKNWQRIFGDEYTPLMEPTINQVVHRFASFGFHQARPVL